MACHGTAGIGRWVLDSSLQPIIGSEGYGAEIHVGRIAHEGGGKGGLSSNGSLDAGFCRLARHASTSLNGQQEGEPKTAQKATERMLGGILDIAIH